MLSQMARIMLCFMAEWYSVVSIYHIFIIHSSVAQHSSCLHNLAFENGAVKNVGVHMYLQISVFIFLDRSQGIKLMYPKIDIFFNILKNIHTIFYRRQTSLYSHQQNMELPFPPHQGEHLFLAIFAVGHSQGCEIVSRYGFESHFLDIVMMNISHVPIVYFYVFFGVVSISLFC